MMRNISTEITLIISFFIVVLSVLIVTAIYDKENVSYAKPSYEKPNTPIITSFQPSAIEDNALKLMINANNDGNNYYVHVWNVTLNRKDNYIPKVALTYQKLNSETEYSVLAQVCKKYLNEYVCSDWTPTNKATTKGKLALSVTLKNRQFTYDGKIKTPIVIVKDTNGKKLRENTDYTLTYNKKSKNIGNYKVVIKGIGQYGGELSSTYQIVPPKVNIKSASSDKDSIKVTINDTSKVKHGAYYETSIYIKNLNVPIKSYRTLNKTVTFKALKSNTSYRIRVRTSKKVGNTYITSAYSTTASISTKSNKKIQLKSSNVSIDKTSNIYTGKKRTPSVKVKYGSNLLVKEKDYKLTYKNNINIGQATAVIKGIGNYTGTINKTFKIYPGNSSIKSTSKTNNSITIQWNKVKGATYYKIGYKKSNGSYKYLDNIKSTSKTITGLSQGTNYKVKVKACKKVSSKAYCGTYSKEKSIKTTSPVTVKSPIVSNNTTKSSTTSPTNNSKNNSTKTNSTKTKSRNKSVASANKCKTNEMNSNGRCVCKPGYSRNKNNKCIKYECSWKSNGTKFDVFAVNKNLSMKCTYSNRNKTKTKLLSGLKNIYRAKKYTCKCKEIS